MNIAKNTLNHVIYPRNTHEYSDAWNSTLMNQIGCITFGRLAFSLVRCADLFEIAEIIYVLRKAQSKTYLSLV